MPSVVFVSERVSERSHACSAAHRLFFSEPGTTLPWLLEKQIKVLASAHETGVKSLDCIQVNLHQKQAHNYAA